MSTTRILLIEDDPGIRFSVREFLELRGYQVVEADSVRSAEALFRAQRPDAVLADYRLEDGNALDLLPRLRAIDGAIPIIILTGHGSVDLAVRAIKEGAQHFLTKPVELPTLAVMLERTLDDHRRRKKDAAGKLKQRREQLDPFLGTSTAIRELAELAAKVARSETTVLILGETGTGKGVLADWLHAASPRAEEPFVNLNCAGLSREFLETELFGHEKGAFTSAVAAKQGLLEIAHKGTLFLDEIGDVDTQVQPKLLKVLEEQTFRRIGDVRDRRVDLRLIAATHQNLSALVAQSRFRADLYFRIATIPIQVPALRDRKEDIPELARHFLDRFSTELGRATLTLEPDAITALQSYGWPGNIRELRNVIERATLLAPNQHIGRKELRFDSVGATTSTDLDLTLEQVERRHIAGVLASENGHVERTAKRLGIPRSSLYQKLKKYQLG